MNARPNLQSIFASPAARKAIATTAALLLCAACSVAEAASLPDTATPVTGVPSTFPGSSTSTTTAPTTTTPTTTTATTTAPTTTAPLATAIAPANNALPETLRSIGPGDCITGGSNNEVLTEAPCPGEGTVLSIVADDKAECENANIKFSGSTTTSDGARFEYTICVETSSEGDASQLTLSELFTEGENCTEATLLEGEVESVLCYGPDRQYFYSEIGVTVDEYLATVVPYYQLEQVGVWGSGEADCGTDYIGQDGDGNPVMISTFSNAPYVVLTTSATLTADELIADPGWTFNSTLC